MNEFLKAIQVLLLMMITHKKISFKRRIFLDQKKLSLFSWQLQDLLHWPAANHQLTG
jgi:hypothetical protein